MRRVLRWTASLVGLVVLAAAAYVGYATWRHERPVALPAPTGAHAVGRLRTTWTDPARHRALSVWLWYPADRGTGHAATYLPGRWAGLHLPAPAGWGETDPRKVRSEQRDAARPARGRFPLVVLLPGLGFSAPQYTTTAVDLASHGYLVAGVTPTGSANLTVLDGHVEHATARGNPRSFTGGHSAASRRSAERLLRVWVADARFAADRVGQPGSPLADHVGEQRSYVGHSFGGASSVEACHEDRRCVAAVDLDGSLFGEVTRTGLDRALLLVGSEKSCVVAACRPRTADDRADVAIARRLLARARPGSSFDVRGAQHVGLSDYSAYYLTRPLRLLLPVGSAPRGRVLRVVDVHLSGFLGKAFAHAA